MYSSGRIAVLLVVLAVIASATVAMGVTGAPTPPVTGVDYADAEGGLVLGGISYTVGDVASEPVATVGESVTITATVTNPGERTGLQGVTLRLDRNGDGVLAPEETIDGIGVVLDAGESKTVRFNLSVPLDIEPGAYAYSVSTVDHTSEGVLTVEPLPTPATYDAVELVGPDSAVQGESVLVAATVTNAGDQNGTGDVAFRFDFDGNGVLAENETVSDVSVDYAGGENGTQTAEIAIPADLEPGTYEYGVFTASANRTANLTVEQAPPSFEVVSVMGTSRTTRTSMLGASAIIENTGDERRTGTVSFRVDQNGDGTLAESETVRTQEVELGPGSSALYSFGAPVPYLRPGTYTYGVYTEVDSMVKEYEIHMASSDSNSNGGSDEITRDDIAQALYDQNVDELDGQQAWQAEDVYDRLPFAEGVSLDGIETREQMAQRMYGKPFTVGPEDEELYTLTKTEALAVQNAYDAQFGPLPTDPEYTLDDLAHGIFWTSFDALGADSAVQVQAVYNRQPLADGYDQYNVQTRREIARYLYDDDSVYVHGWQSLGSEPGLTVEDLLKIQQAYDAQFGDE